VSKELDVHIIVDTQSVHGAHEIKRWLQEASPVSYAVQRILSSWLNLVERWFANLRQDAIRRGSHLSVHQLVEGIMAYIDATNEDPTLFGRIESADRTLASV
jgi:hypothetical protein